LFFLQVRQVDLIDKGKEKELFNQRREKILSRKPFRESIQLDTIAEKLFTPFVRLVAGQQSSQWD
jgi:hypothetical protein